MVVLERPVGQRRRVAQRLFGIGFVVASILTIGFLMPTVASVSGATASVSETASIVGLDLATVSRTVGSEGSSAEFRPLAGLGLLVFGFPAVVAAIGWLYVTRRSSQVD